MATASSTSSPARTGTKAPRWTKHKFRAINYTNNYIDDFSDLPLDVNGDGHIDIVSCSWFAKRLWWIGESRQAATASGRSTTIESGFSIEFAFLVDLDNDGKSARGAAAVRQREAPLAWYEAKNGAFVKHVVSPKSYGHGIGAGDVNGDGRTDILTPKGWFEAPPDPRTGDWKLHAIATSRRTGFIYVLDVNGDGRNDLVTSMAHDYGIFWMEHGAGQQVDEAHDRRQLVAGARHDHGRPERRRPQGLRHRQALHGAQRPRSRRARAAGHLLVRIP